MDKLNFGDIVLLKFPYTDGKTYKKRPALLINDYSDGDVIVCRITSRLYKTGNDIYIEDWQQSGLKLPSVIRVHKLATLDKDMIERIMGKTNANIKNKVKMLISNLPKQ
jgi:mRNA interferase MazF